MSKSEWSTLKPSAALSSLLDCLSTNEEWLRASRNPIEYQTRLTLPSSVSRTMSASELSVAQRWLETSMQAISERLANSFLDGLMPLAGNCLGSSLGAETKKPSVLQE